MPSSIVGYVPSGGLTVTPEMRKLAERPGLLSDVDGAAQAMRDMYTQESSKFDPTELSPFGMLCFIGAPNEVKRAVDCGHAPDLTTYETPFKWGYLTLTVVGAQRVQLAGKQPVKQLAVLQYLIKQGAPLDLKDIAWYTALHHATIRNSVPLLARALLEAGASPNWTDKYGGPPLHGACMAKQLESIELLMEFGADLSIKEANGWSMGPTNFIRFGPEVAAPIHKWLRRRQGVKAPLEEEGTCDACSKAPSEGDKRFSYCAACKMVRYCSKECQKTKWPEHKQICKRFDESNSLTFKPHYPNTGIGEVPILLSNAEITRHTMYTEAKTPQDLPFKVNKLAYAPPTKEFVDNGRGLIVKVQIPLRGPPELVHNGDCLVYNKKRDFLCNLNRASNPKEYSLIVAIIKARGVGGAKAYFRAELPERDKLVIRAAEMLAEQTF